MKRFGTSALACLLSIFLTVPVVALSADQPAPQAAAQPAARTPERVPFRIGVEDVLEINVWKNPDMGRQVWVRPDGKITLPLVGEVMADGLTIQELTDLLVSRFKEYFTDPGVTVSLVDVNSYQIYLLGRVSKPGPVKLRSPRTFLQVLAIGGGFQEFAESAGVVVVRWEKGQEKRIPVDARKLMKGNQPDFMLEPGDVIIVP